MWFKMAASLALCEADSPSVQCMMSEWRIMELSVERLNTFAVF